MTVEYRNKAGIGHEDLTNMPIYCYAEAGISPYKPCEQKRPYLEVGSCFCSLLLRKSSYRIVVCVDDLIKPGQHHKRARRQRSLVQNSD